MYFRFTLRVQHQSSLSIDRNFLKFSKESQKRKSFRNEKRKKTEVSRSFWWTVLKSIAARTDSSYCPVTRSGSRAVESGGFLIR
jgi:hypothetical protein